MRPLALSEVASPAARANRRRLFVFLGVFVVSCAASLGYNFTRPAEYRAAARVQINPGSVRVESLQPAASSQGATAPQPFLNELQVLTSRPIVEAAMARLDEQPGAVVWPSLSASAAAGTDVVELIATAADRALAAGVVNEVIAVYKERLERAHRSASGEALAQVEEELARLAVRVAAGRKAVDDFSATHNVVSLEREENEVLTRVRGLGTALNNASEKLAAAEGRLRSLEQSAAQGKSVVRARDNPMLANLEQRASQIREELGELERSYTAEYLAMDHRVRAQRTRLAELEQQIKIERRLSEQSSLAEAREEVNGLRETANRIRQQLAADRGAARAFSSRFSEYKALREELAQLEALHRDASQRKARLEAGERARRPVVRVLEAATIPLEPWRPHYGRDAAIGIGGSLLLALFLIWLVELFNRNDPQPTILVPQPIAYSPAAPPAGRLSQAAPGLLTAGGAPLLAERSARRELTAAEIRALLAAATTEARLAILLLLGGLSPEEVIALRCDDIDLSQGEIHVAGASKRTVSTPFRLDAFFVRDARQGEASLLGRRLEDLTADLLCAAYDAGLERPSEVTPDALRHTYVAFLARQGMRLADLGNIVGRLSADEVALYSAFAPPGKRVAAEQVNLRMDL
jgi:uncharacterized protein involved in exopolysaccharide biosynthesis